MFFYTLGLGKLKWKNSGRLEHAYGQTGGVKKMLTGSTVRIGKRDS